MCVLLGFYESIFFKGRKGLCTFMCLQVVTKHVCVDTQMG